MLRLRHRSCVLPLLALAACSGSSGRPTPSVEPVPAPAVDAAAPPWRTTDAGAPRSQRLRAAAVLHTRVDSAVRSDTITSDIVVSWSQVPDSVPARFVGMLERYAVRVNADTAWRTPAALELPSPFVAVQERPNSQPLLLFPRGGSCDSPAAIATEAWRDSWLQLPASVTPNSAWSDTTDYTLCRDGIPLVVRAVRRFVVEGVRPGAEGLLLLLRRESQLALAGHGVQFGDSVQVQGEGSGSLQLAVALRGGAIVAGDGTSTLRLELRGSRRTQVLEQHSTLTLGTLPPR